MGISERGSGPDEFIDFGHIVSLDDETVTIIQMLALGGGMVMYPREEVTVKLFSLSAQRPEASNILHFVPVEDNRGVEREFPPKRALKRSRSVKGSL